MFKTRFYNPENRPRGARAGKLPWHRGHAASWALEMGRPSGDSVLAAAKDRARSFTNTHNLSGMKHFRKPKVKQMLHLEAI